MVGTLFSRPGRCHRVADRHANRQFDLWKKAGVSKPVGWNRGSGLPARTWMDENADVVWIRGFGRRRLANLPALLYAIEYRPQERALVRRCNHNRAGTSRFLRSPASVRRHTYMGQVDRKMQDENIGDPRSEKANSEMIMASYRFHPAEATGPNHRRRAAPRTSGRFTFLT